MEMIITFVSVLCYYRGLNGLPYEALVPENDRSSEVRARIQRQVLHRKVQQLIEMIQEMSLSVALLAIASNSILPSISR